MNVTVGDMNSVFTQAPIRYFNLGICVPEKVSVQTDHIAEMLGETFYYTDYEISINENKTCQILCKKEIKKEDYEVLSDFIRLDYRTNWYLDKLPAGYNHTDSFGNNVKKIHYSGIPLGISNEIYEDVIDLYNHYTFFVELHKEKDGNFSIVGFTIHPYSIQHNDEIDITNCQQDAYNFRHSTKIKQKLMENINITYTYDVFFTITDKYQYTTRWDHIFQSEEDNIHFYNLINSSLIILILSALILLIFCRAVKKDIEIYNSRVTSEDIIDEYGWKQVCNDVFRKPQHPMLLSSFIGTGIQV
jgi:transmembrane 9 superfamily protein 2/4